MDAAEAMGVRVVKLRTGIVLSPEGGALAKFRKPLRLGVAAILGNGQQVVSWIHIDDLCRMFIQSLEQPGWSGAYNAVAPAPVTNKMLTLELAEILRGRFFIPVYVPAFLLKWIMGESSIEVLKSCTVSAGKVKQQGFTSFIPRSDLRWKHSVENKRTALHQQGRSFYLVSCFLHWKVHFIYIEYPVNLVNKLFASYRAPVYPFLSGRTFERGKTLGARAGIQRRVYF